MNLFQIVVAPVLGFFALASLARARHRGPRRLGALLWAAIWFVGAGLVLRPNLSTRISSFFGIGRGADFLFYIAVVSGLYAILALYGRLRKLENALTEVVREQAIRGATFSSETPRPDGESPK